MGPVEVGPRVSFHHPNGFNVVAVKEDGGNAKTMSRSILFAPQVVTKGLGELSLMLPVLTGQEGGPGGGEAWCAVVPQVRWGPGPYFGAGQEGGGNGWGVSLGHRRVDECLLRFLHESVAIGIDGLKGDGGGGDLCAVVESGNLCGAGV